MSPLPYTTEVIESLPSPTEKQIDYLDRRLTKMEADMISPIEFGKLLAENESVRRDLEALVKSVDKLTTKMETIESTLSEAKGGWKVLMLVGGASATLGGVLSYVLQHIKFS